MSKIPIDIVKLFKEGKYIKDNLRFQIVIREKEENWHRYFECGVAELIKFHKELTDVVNSIKWYEILDIDEALATRIEDSNNTDEICSGCNYKKSKSCVTCLTVLQSPLERKLYPKLLESKLYFEVQVPINVFGNKAQIINNDAVDLRLKYADLLTQTDFYLPNGRNPICVYTDGHSYHERTEEQAKRDRGIDRKLQELGFVVMRFTGKDINESLDMVVNQIKRMADKKY